MATVPWLVAGLGAAGAVVGAAIVGAATGWYTVLGRTAPRRIE